MQRIGRENCPIVVIDDFAVDPEALRTAAAAMPFGPARNLYPGVRAELPDDYWHRQDEVVSAATAALRDRDTAFTVIDGSFSIVATAPDKLVPGQRLPHCDAYDVRRIAFVHYLMRDGSAGGTAFFRHRSTGFEFVDERRRSVYHGQVEAELRQLGPPPATYVGESDRLFEQIAMVEACYNRAVFYPSFLLHSGAITPTAKLSPDPAHGRLTVTGFLSTA